MATLSNTRALSALEDIIKEQATSMIQNFSVDEIVDAILQRQDHQSIQEKLFNRLDRNDISSIISANEDSHGIYMDIFKELIAKIVHPTQTQSEQSNSAAINIHRSASTTTTASTQTDMVTIRVPTRSASVHNYSSQALGTKEFIYPIPPQYPGTVTPADSIQCTLEHQESNSTAYEYITANLVFEPRVPHLNAWIPTFMSEDELCHSEPSMKEMRVNRQGEQFVNDFFRFIKLLNPSYLCCRVEYLAADLASQPTATLPKLNTMGDLVRSWNAGNKGIPTYISSAIVAFVAVRSFEMYEGLVKAASQDNSSASEQDINLRLCNRFKRLDPETDSVSKWQRIISNGSQLSSLSKDFGGESFLLLFPLREVHKWTSLQPSNTYLWGAVRGLLEKTGLGEFFRSLSSAVGSSLLSDFWGDGVLRRGLWAQLAPVLEEYSLKGVTPDSPKPGGDHLYVTPEMSPFSYCGEPNRVIRLSPESSLRPTSLFEFEHGMLGEDLVRHLIHQRISSGWSILGKADITETANEDMLLHDFRGIVIPLYINNAWCLLCYVNPTRSKVTYPITFVDSTRSEHRFHAALAMLSKWIPMDEDWIPEEITARTVKVVESQASSERDSGIHVVLNALSMAKTQKPETRPLDAVVCRALRVRYFVGTLNEMQQAASKESAKRRA